MPNTAIYNQAAWQFFWAWLPWMVVGTGIGGLLLIVKLRLKRLLRAR